MVSKKFKIPKKWGISPQQELVIGSLVDEAGSFIPSDDFCEALYKDYVKGAAPAKLRVLIQRCRYILEKQTKGRVEIVVRRNSGWKITKKSSLILRKIVAEKP